LDIQLAQDVSMALYQHQRYEEPGFGVPLVLVGKRCVDTPLCHLLPPEGVFRAATAWIEPGGAHERAPFVLVIANPLSISDVRFGGVRVSLSLDTSAPYAYGIRRTKLPRLAVWGLLGGSEVGRRAGVYLLEDYDPAKRPIVMIHGLGSSPLAWAKLTNAIWAEPELRAHFQIWHVVYQTSAPLLVTRLRIASYLDEAWAVLDPEANDTARQGMVLVGHSMGGVIARLLSADSKTVLWDAAFESTLDKLNGNLADKGLAKRIFTFDHYPGVSTTIFLASPHGGSPSADAWFGRLARILIGRRTTEMQSLKRLARANPLAVHEELRVAYQQADVNSISTLQSSQPVSRAGAVLLPSQGIFYHVISGVLPNRYPATDGSVPLTSTILPGATSTLIVHSGHDVYDNDEAIAEVTRILIAASSIRGSTP
jgi:pimeloyl-ACP methyl ester carboxylesterase